MSASHAPNLTRRGVLRLAAAGAVGLCLPGCASLKNWLAPRPFTLVALPDTQYYAKDYPQHFMAQTEWIAQNAQALNIAAVIHEGDITDNNVPEQWENASRALAVLERARIPYFLTMGNHDNPKWGNERDATLFNEYFPLSRIEKIAGFGGTMQGGSENAYYFFNASGRRFLVVCLEFGPRDETVAWANDVVAAHPGCPAIIVTHCYMYYDDTRVGEGDQWNPHTYECGGNDGDELWEKLVSRHANIFMVLSGHILGDGTGRMTSAGLAGNPVHQILANYQMLEEGGQGWLRLMTLDPAADRLSVKTYSPVLGRWADDPQNQFELPLDLK